MLVKRQETQRLIEKLVLGEAGLQGGKSIFREFQMRKKRGQNQGSVYQRSSDKRWVGQVTIQKKHHMKYFSSQPEAEAWVRQALLLIGQGLPLAGTQPPWNHIDLWMFTNDC